MGKSVQQPPAPNYAAAATAQGQANQDAAKQSFGFSNPNIFTPYGSSTVGFTYNPLTGQDDYPQFTQSLTPTGQQTVDQQQQAQLGLSQLANSQIGKVGDILGTPFGFGGTPQTSLPNAGPIAQTVNPSGYQLGGGPSASQYGLAAGAGAAPKLQTTLDESGVAKLPVNAGTTGQQAIMSRLEPNLQRQRQQLETQLINQGLRPGGEAYNNAIDLLGQQENDARQQAALQGLNLDFTANQQGFGQAQTRGDFGNNAALQQYGAGLSGTQLGNQAIAQNFGQGQSAQQAQNAAIQQNFGNQLNYQGAQNAAQQQAFNQNLQGGQFGNSAIAQALQQALAQRDLPLNEITALLSGSQVQNPQFQTYQGANIAPAPVFAGAQAQDAYNQNIYNQQVAQKNAMTQGLFSLAAAPFSMFSF